MNVEWTPDSYLEPSPRMRELQILELLADRPEISQNALAEQVGLAPARVNAYIKMFVERDEVRTENRSRGMAYHLTEKGKHCLAFHQVTYRAELVRLRQAARARIRQFFSGLRGQGLRRVILYGAGETAQVVADSLVGTEVVTLLAVIDDDTRKQGRLWHGLPVRSRHAINHLAPDAIVITSICFADAIRERLRAYEQKGIPILSLTS